MVQVACFPNAILPDMYQVWSVSGLVMTCPLATGFRGLGSVGTNPQSPD
jgi:hypothetical protein